MQRIWDLDKSEDDVLAVADVCTTATPEIEHVLCSLVTNMISTGSSSTPSYTDSHQSIPPSSTCYLAAATAPFRDIF